MIVKILMLLTLFGVASASLPVIEHVYLLCEANETLPYKILCIGSGNPVIIEWGWLYNGQPTSQSFRLRSHRERFGDEWASIQIPADMSRSNYSCWARNSEGRAVQNITQEFPTIVDTNGEKECPSFVSSPSNSTKFLIGVFGAILFVVILLLIACVVPIPMRCYRRFGIRCDDEFLSRSQPAYRVFI